MTSTNRAQEGGKSTGSWECWEVKVPRTAHIHSHTCTHMAKISCLHISLRAVQADKALQRPCSSSSPRRGRGLAAHTWSSYESSSFCLKTRSLNPMWKLCPGPFPDSRRSGSGNHRSPRQPHSLCPLSRQEATSALTPVYQHEEGRMFHRRRGYSTCDGKHLWTISARSLMPVRSERNTADSYFSKDTDSCPRSFRHIWLFTHLLYN